MYNSNGRRNYSAHCYLLLHMKKILSFLFFVSISLSGYCHTSENGNTENWIEASLMRVPEFNNGWNLSPFSGGTSIDGASFKFSIQPIKKSNNLVKKEFIALVKRQLQNDGYSITGEGTGTGNGQITSTTIRVKSDKYLGTMVIGFFPEMYKEQILGIVAIAQISNSK